ncbi:MAG: hypothetical protein Q8832_02630, partial [Candidatus Phytoplasma australasiaticum]|nr:hypothetical protein [Candidatus Phytoplasma australasiaticum]
HSNTTTLPSVPRPSSVLIPRRTPPETKNNGGGAAFPTTTKQTPTNTNPVPIDPKFNDLNVSINNNIKQYTEIQTRIQEIKPENINFYSINKTRKTIT